MNAPGTLDCGSGCRGFDPRHSPQITAETLGVVSPLAPPRVPGSAGYSPNTVQRPDLADDEAAASEPLAGAVRVPLGHGLFALVDAADVDRVLGLGLTWRARRAKRSNVTYAVAMRTLVPGRKGKRVPVGLHRVIVGAVDGEIVDHIDFDGLNNRRSNLRICSKRQNCQHGRRAGIKGTQKNRGGWRATIVAPAVSGPGIPTYLGSFATRELAGRAYDVAALALFGEFAQTNFPKADYTAELVAAVLSAGRNSSNALRGGYRGVSQHKHSQLWRAVISAGELRADGRRDQVTLGSFIDPVDAARAYDAAALRHFGESAKVNFGPSDLEKAIARAKNSPAPTPATEAR